MQTIQSISLLAYLAEHHGIWGPFLVIAPASTLHNWQQELQRFVPRLKAIPYWGVPKDREVLRKIWSRKNQTFNEDSPFHILITSYQMVSFVPVHCLYRRAALILLGCHGREILLGIAMAVHDFGRSASHQELSLEPMEISLVAALQKPATFDRYTYPEFHAG
jgi:hypothetical protein